LTPEAPALFPNIEPETHISFGPEVAEVMAMHTDSFPHSETSPATSLIIKSTTNLQSMSNKFGWPFIILVGSAMFHGAAIAQSHAYSSSLPDAPQVQIERGLGFFPIVQAPGANDPYAPLSAKQKFQAFARTTFDPSAIVVAALGAGITQPGNSQPQYGEGSVAFGQRVGATAAGYGSATFFTNDLLPTVLHQDPRYFQKGQGSVASRIWYAATRTLVTRQDSGRSNINASFLGGFAMSVALSNAYYPDRNRNASDAAARYGEGVAISAVFNVVREFVVKPH
jgi:hypothetical protein